MHPEGFLKVYLDFRGDNVSLMNYYKKSDRTIRDYVASLLRELRTQGKDIVYYRNEYGYDYPVRVEEVENAYKPKQTTVKKNDGEIRLYGDAVVLGDVHIPQQDDSIIEQVCSFGSKANPNGIENLVLNGDTLNLDELSTFGDKQKNCNWRNEKKTAKAIFRKFFDSFERVFFVPGNHEYRIRTGTEFTLELEDLFEILIPESCLHRFYSTDRDYIIINDSWKATHMREYSRKHGTKAGALAVAERMNVILAHSHMLSEHQVVLIEKNNDDYKVNEYWYLDGGHACDINKIDYKKKKTSLHGEWKSGFIVIRDNKHTVVSQHKPKIHRTEHLNYFKQIVKKMIW